jgi:hypothetical protein
MRKTRSRRHRNQTRRKGRRTRGGMAPVSAPATILLPEEMQSMYVYLPYDDMTYDHTFLDSRTPLLNTAVKLYAVPSL